MRAPEIAKTTFRVSEPVSPIGALGNRGAIRFNIPIREWVLKGDSDYLPTTV